jgi:hypothetical protein
MSQGKLKMQPTIHVLPILLEEIMSSFNILVASPMEIFYFEKRMSQR